MRLLILVLLLSLPAFSQENKEPNFPTTEEIQLVVSQAERAFDQYDNTVTLEAALSSMKLNKSGLEKDRQVSEMSRKLINALKKNLDGFHGLGGFLLLSSLDDASRNLSLCSASAFAEVSTGLMSEKGLDRDKAYELLHIAQACQDSSVQLYTISENVHALMVRELDGQQTTNNRAMEAINACTAALKQKQQK